MKRAMTGGAHRGPVAPPRQRRTIRFVQILLAVIAAGLFALAGYSFGKAQGFDQGRAADALDEPRPPSAVQTVVLVVFGGAALGCAWLLQQGDTLRIPTPARLEELVGRAEQAAIERAEEAADPSGPAG
ncbi:MAG TPA: hypothetical protein VFK89_06950 [Actinomycetota bacterium]|nr:hypothetical protein [Actinomycetota bacterium]